MGKYDGEHKRLRAFWAPKVAAGQGYCHELICVSPGGRWIQPGTKWHLAHDVDGVTYRGPAHDVCNLSEAGIRGNRGRKGRPKRPSVRRWTTTREW